MEKERKQKLIKLAEAIKESLMVGSIGIDILVDEARLSWTSISTAGIFRNECWDLLLEIEKIRIISEPYLSEWREYPSYASKEGVIENGFIMEVDTKKLNVFIGAKIPTKTKSEIMTKTRPNLIVENRIGYLKFYKQGIKIKIGGIKTRKFRLLDILINPLGVAKTIDIVFDSIKLSKDKSDSQLSDNYLSPERQRNLIDYTMKELQKIKELKGKIRLEYVDNKRSVRLIIDT